MIIVIIIVIIIIIIVVGVIAQVIQLLSSSSSSSVSRQQSHCIDNIHSTAPTSSKADVKEPEDEQQVDDMKQERSDSKYSYK
jgi:flagellar basal body-associated protein FliL